LSLLTRTRHLRRNGETDRGAPRIRRSKAAWNCVDCYASRVKTLFHGVHRWLIIDFHREPIEARPFGVASAGAIVVLDVDSHVVVIATR
jgi:hypothetical protein